MANKNGANLGFESQLWAAATFEKTIKANLKGLGYGG